MPAQEISRDSFRDGGASLGSEAEITGEHAIIGDALYLIPGRKLQVRYDLRKAPGARVFIRTEFVPGPLIGGGFQFL